MPNSRIWSIFPVFWLIIWKWLENFGQVNVIFKFICISVDMAQGSLLATGCDKLVTVTFCVFSSICLGECVCVCHWSSLLAADGGLSLEWVMRFGVTTGGMVWMAGENDGGCLKNGSRRLRSNPINWGNCAERILEWGGGGWGWVCKGERGSKTEMWWLHFYYF